MNKIYICFTIILTASAASASLFECRNNSILKEPAYLEQKADKWIFSIKKEFCELQEVEAELEPINSNYVDWLILLNDSSNLPCSEFNSFKHRNSVFLTKVFISPSLKIKNKGFIKIVYKIKNKNYGTKFNKTFLKCFPV